MEFAVTLGLNIISAICILMMIGIGMAIIFGLMDVINLAHGEFVTIGAFTLAVVSGMGGSYWVALALAPLVGGLAGIILERLLIRHLYQQPLNTILVTWGMSLIITQSILLIFGTEPMAVTAPVAGLAHFAGVAYPAYRLLLIAVTLLMLGICMYVFRYTRFGLDLRVTIQDREMAEALGIDTRGISAIAFAAGAGLAATAGVLIAPLVAVQAYMGIFYLARAFFVVIIGGVGGFMGVAVGSSLVGTMETLLSYEMSPTLAQAAVLLLAIGILRVKPQGLIPGR